MARFIGVAASALLALGMLLCAAQGAAARASASLDLLKPAGSISLRSLLEEGELAEGSLPYAYGNAGPAFDVTKSELNPPTTININDISRVADDNQATGLIEDAVSGAQSTRTVIAQIDRASFGETKAHTPSAWSNTNKYGLW